MGRGALLHLTGRFLGSLSPRPLSEADRTWVGEVLGPGEARLWERMPEADRKHAAGVAREVQHRLGARATPAVLAAALLHDVGKIESGLGTPGRVFATIVTALVGRRRVEGWEHAEGVSGRLGRYAAHPRLGGELLQDADADPITVAWAREHHRPEHTWSVPMEVGRALRDADDD